MSLPVPRGLLHDEHAVPGGRVEVNVVHPRAGAADQSQRRSRLDHLSRHLGRRAHKQRVVALGKTTAHVTSQLGAHQQRVVALRKTTAHVTSQLGATAAIKKNSGGIFPCEGRTLHSVCIQIWMQCRAVLVLSAEMFIDQLNKH